MTGKEQELLTPTKIRNENDHEPTIRNIPFYITRKKTCGKFLVGKNFGDWYNESSDNLYWAANDMNTVSISDIQNERELDEED